MQKLRRQRHEAALKHANNRILEHMGTLLLNNATLEDLQTMLSVIQDEDLARGWEPQNVMWDMLDALVWNLVDENEVIEARIEQKHKQIAHVLKLNHDTDEDEAYDTKAEFEEGYHPRFCGLPIIGARR